MAGAKGKSGSGAVALDPPADDTTVDDPEDLALLGDLDGQAFSGEVLLVDPHAGTQVIESAADLDAAVGTYKAIDDQLDWLHQHQDTFATGGTGGGPLDAGQAYDWIASQVDDDPDLAELFGDAYAEQFGEVYEAFTDGVEATPQWKLDQLEAAKAWVDALNDPDLPVTSKYDALQTYADTVLGLEDAAGDAWPDEFAALKADTKQWLDSLSPADLRDVAHAHDVSHPMLLSGGNPHDVGNNALAAVLDPAYPADSPHKQTIAAKAHERYQALVGGTIESYKGVTLADVDADDAAHGAAIPVAQGDSDVFAVGPDQLTELQALHTTAYGYTTYVSTGDRLVARTELNWKLHQAAPVGGVTEADLAALAPTMQSSYHSTAAANAHLDALSQITGHDTVTLGVASMSDKALLLDPATSDDVLAEVGQRVEETKALLDKRVQLSKQALPIFESASPTAEDITTLVGAWNAAAGDVVPYGTKAEAHLSPEDAALAHAYGGATVPHPQQLRAWMKDRKLADLRAAAAATGLGAAADPPTPRATIQNYLIAKARNSEAQAMALKQKADGQQQSAAAKKAAKDAAVAAGHVPAPASSASAPKFVKATVTSAQAVGAKIKHVSYAKQLDDLEALLKQAQGAAADVPARADSQVAAADLVPDSTANVTGGSHTTIGYRDQTTDQRYFAKPYGNSGGRPRAIAEAVASQVKADVGLPAIPCYHRKVDGQDAAVQPKVDGVAPLGNAVDPASLSQADVDTIVRNEVGDWLVGDHDGNGNNWLRTASGSLVRCDLGQGFKHYGGDKLQQDYAPAQNVGQPLFKKVMGAAGAGKLGDGVKVNPNVAVGVVQNVEKLSPQQFRDRMRPVAESGVTAGNAIAWVPRMRKAAAKTHGIPEQQVSDSQVVDAFLDHAEQRRTQVRSEFSRYFADAGLDASALKYVT